jgi:hypothetical protein
MKMRELNCSGSCRRPVLFIFLVSCLFLFQGLTTEQKFWAPSSSPQSHYRIEARIDLQSRTVEGSEKILIHNTSSSPMSLFAMEMPVPVKAVFEDGTSQIKLSNRLFKVNTLVFESKFKLKEVVLDPDHKLAMLSEPLPVLPEDLSDAISELPWTGAGEKALKSFEKAKEMKIEEARLWFKLGMTLFDGGYYQESFEAFLKLTELKPSELDFFSALVWMGHLKDLTGSREEAVKHYNEALKHDTGQTMRHDQCGLQINRAWVEERLKTPFQWGKKSK